MSDGMHMAADIQAGREDLFPRGDNMTTRRNVSIQRYFDYARDRGRAWVPAGEYVVTQPVNARNIDHARIEWHPRAVILPRFDQPDWPVIDATGSTWLDIPSVRIDNSYRKDLVHNPIGPKSPVSPSCGALYARGAGALSANYNRLTNAEIIGYYRYGCVANIGAEFFTATGGDWRNHDEIGFAYWTSPRTPHAPDESFILSPHGPIATGVSNVSCLLDHVHLAADYPGEHGCVYAAGGTGWLQLRGCRYTAKSECGAVFQIGGDRPDIPVHGLVITDSYCETFGAGAVFRFNSPTPGLRLHGNRFNYRIDGNAINGAMADPANTWNAVTP